MCEFLGLVSVDKKKKIIRETKWGAFPPCKHGQMLRKYLHCLHINNSKVKHEDEALQGEENCWETSSFITYKTPKIKIERNFLTKTKIIQSIDQSCRPMKWKPQKGYDQYFLYFTTFTF